METIYYGHTCVDIRIGDIHLLIDPFISENSPASHINVNGVPADYILITTTQQDHTYDVEGIARRTNTKTISNYEAPNHYLNLGIENLYPTDLGGAYNFPFGSTKMIPALHSSTSDNGSVGGYARGFTVKTLDKTVYVADAAASRFDMQLAPVHYRVDLAILPIGGNFTMDVEDVIIASDFVKRSKVLGYYYDTSPLIKVDNKDLTVRSFKAKGKKLILLGVGQRVLA